MYTTDQNVNDVNVLKNCRNRQKKKFRGYVSRFCQYILKINQYFRSGETV